MEDIKLGRALASQASIVNVTNANAVTVLGPDPNRTRIVFSSDGTDSIFLAPEGFTPANLSGFVIRPPAPILTVRVEDWGGLVIGRWKAISAIGASNLAIMVSTLDKQ